MTKYSIIIIVFIFCSCKQREEKNAIPVNMTDTIVTDKEKTAAEQLNEQIGDTIEMINTDSAGNYSAIGTIDSIHSRIYVKFTNKEAANLKATITTMEGDGNIRFNQILFPDQTSDGPFGKEMEHELKTTGIHTLIIGHSLMAEGRYEGKFKVDVKLTSSPN
ncbi:hypothetical protein [Flavobacterium wongokense]|uniref:hypothetical protein n=1 Tax=Flavobacterium wongokense TaxID=2910674 RepID=UPI001F30F760|nr:hypothetical protein [Flavobacterium sp. WG47]MCF6131929.1 hypothetical protein [Flavobacterium sp. WG47]